MHNWEQISSILDRALDLEPDERMAFIEDICETEPVLKASVIHFLASIEPSEELWDKMVESSSVLVNEITRSDTDFDTSQFFSPLKQAGPYRVIDLIARGGMGNVYLAERSDGQFERKVAIKILRHELSSKNHVKRFSAERNILSGLEHPKIARLYDGGLTTDNRPYLVMEFVDGVPITSYCKENGCTLKEILNLFTQVCKAVEYAHRNLIVHRDLKPDNILVKRDGTVKILDFGIAKILNDELTPEKFVQTKENLHMLSIQYAAPEQITLGKITTATDVYALGLLLYEMITGEPPFDLKGKKLKKAENVILNEQPEKPSQKSGSLKHPGKLKGDLDAIILKAVNKKPEERYTSVDQLMGDIHLHLISRPISARPDKKSYRVWKFIQRRPGVVTGIFLGFIVITSYLVTLQLHAEQLKEERDRVELEASRAGIMSEFLVELFESADPLRSTDSDLSARDLLEQGVERIDLLDAQPDLQAKISLTMARAYHALGFYDDALLLVDRTLVSYQESSDAQEMIYTEALEVRGMLLRAKGDYDAAEPLLRESLAIRRSYLGDEHTEVARAMTHLGILLRAKGDYDAAEPLFRESLAMRRLLLGDEHPSVASSMNTLAGLLRAKGDFDAAEPLYRESLTMRRELLGDEHPSVASSINNLGGLLRAKGDYDAAEPLYRESLAMSRKLFGEEHPNVAIAINNLGLLLRVKGDYDAAEPLYRESLAMRRRLLGDEHPDVARAISNLGVLLRAKGDYDAAEPLYRESLAMRRQLLGDEHPDVARAISNLGGLFYAKGDYNAAEPLYHESLAMRRRLLGDEHPDVASSINNLGGLMRAKGDYDAAEPLYRESLAMRRLLLGDEHPSVASSMNHLGGLLLAKGDYDVAEPLYRESLAMRRRILGEEHPSVASSMNNLGGLLLAKGDYDAAEPLYRKSLAMRRRILGEEHPSVASSMNNLGGLLLEKGDLQTAEELFHESLDMRRRLLGDEHPSIADSYESFYKLFLEQGEYEKALSKMRDALDIRIKTFGEDHPDVITTRSNLNDLIVKSGNSITGQ